MAKLPWVERTFTFDFPVEIYPDVVERFRGGVTRGHRGRHCAYDSPIFRLKS